MDTQKLLQSTKYNYWSFLTFHISFPNSSYIRLPRHRLQEKFKLTSKKKLQLLFKKEKKKGNIKPEKEWKQEVLKTKNK